MEFGGDGIRCDILVMRRELVPRQAEGADPDPSPNIDLAIGASAGSMVLQAQQKLAISRRRDPALWRRPTRKGSRLIDKAACKSRARIAVEGYPASPSVVYKERRSERRVAMLPAETVRE